MPPTTRPKRVSAPASRVYEGTDPLKQQHFKPRRQKVYGRHSLGAPRAKKQETLTQIGFINPNIDKEIEEDIEEFEREDRERAKRRKTTTPRSLRAKPVNRRFGAELTEDVPELQDEDMGLLNEPLVEMQQERAISALPNETVPKKKRKSTKGITIRVVNIKKEPVDSQDEAGKNLDDAGNDTEMVKDSFYAMPEKEAGQDIVPYSSLGVQSKKASPDLDAPSGNSVGTGIKRRRSIIPDSDDDSDEEEIIPDSHETVDNDIDIVMDSDAEPEVDKAKAVVKEPERVIPDSDADSDDDWDQIEDSQLPPLLDEEAVRDSFVVKDSFVSKTTVISGPQAEVKKPPRTIVEDSFATSSLHTQSTMSSSPADAADQAVQPNENKADTATMPPPQTPSRKRVLEIPSSNSPTTPLSGKSTRNLTPSSARTIYARSPLKRMHENVLPLAISRQLSPRVNASQRSMRSTRSAIHESQISTQDPTQSPMPPLEVIPDSSPMRAATPRNQTAYGDSQDTAGSETPSKQLHSELSASSKRHPSSGQQPSSSHAATPRPKRTTKTEIADSQDEDSDFEILTQPSYSSSQPRAPSSPIKQVAGTPTPKAVRFRETPAYVPESEVRSSPVAGGNLGSRMNGDVPSSGGRSGITGLESQWQGDNLLPDSLLADSLSLPPILDDDEVWDEI